MKKVFTLIFCLGTFVSVFAQSSHHGEYNKRGRSYGNGKHDRYKNDIGRNRLQNEIERINKTYENKIDWVSRHHSMSPFEKRRMVKRLQNDRKQELKDVYARYQGNRDYYERSGNRNW